MSEDYGDEIGKQYDIGAYLPLFILISSEGETIIRWDGYSNANKFVNALNRGMNDQTTIKEREIRFRQKPTKFDINVLGHYYEDTKRYRQAGDLYRQAEANENKEVSSYTMRIFQSFANGAWHNKLPFDSVLPAADMLFDNPNSKAADIIRATRMVSNVARRKNRTDQIKKYLIAGIKLTKEKNNKKSKENYYLFGADYALYVAHDTVKAIAIKKKGMGKDWKQILKTYYPFAKYCYDRRINIDEAYELCIAVTERVQEDKYRAKVFSLLAKIKEYNGDFEAAMNFVDRAMTNDPDNEYYPTQYDELMQESVKE